MQPIKSQPKIARIFCRIKEVISLITAHIPGQLAFLPDKLTSSASHLDIPSKYYYFWVHYGINLKMAIINPGRKSLCHHDRPGNCAIRATVGRFALCSIILLVFKVFELFRSTLLHYHTGFM